MLNRHYRTAISKTSRSASIREALKEAQRAWIVYRDANSRFTVGLTQNNSKAVTNTLALDTIERAKFIEEWYIGYHSLPNDTPREALHTASEKLNNAIQQLRAKLTPQNAGEFDEVQKAWGAFHERDLAFQRKIGMVQSPEARRHSQRVTAEARTARIHQLVTALESVLGTNKMPGAITSNKYPESTSPDQWKRLPDPGIEALPVPPEPSGEAIRPQVIDRLNYGSLVLDMEENLLVGTTADFFDFWDVQSGSLIRRVPNTGVDGHYAYDGAFPLHNLGKGRVIALGGFRGGDVIIWLHRNAEKGQRIEEVSNKRGNRISTVTTGDMAARMTGDLAYFGTQNVQLLLGAAEGGWRQFERADDKDYSWGMSQDGSRLLVASTDLTDDEALTTLSCLDTASGKLLSKETLPKSEKFVSAICGAAASDEFFMTTGAGSLVRYHATRGSVDHESSLVHSLIHVPGWQSHWLAGSQSDWCLFGGHPTTKSKTGQHERGTDSIVRASRGAPKAVHEMVENWKDIRNFALDREGEYAAVSTRAGHVDIYHIGTGRVVQTLGKFTPPEPIEFTTSIHQGGQLAMIHQFGSDAPELQVVDTTRFGESRIPLQILKAGSDETRNAKSNLSVGMGASNSLFAYQQLSEVYEFNKSIRRTNLRSLLPDGSEGQSPALPGRHNLSVSGNGVILGSHMYKEAPVAVAVDSFTQEKLAEFSLASFPEKSELIAYHRETGKGIVYSYSDSLIALCEPGKTLKESATWNMVANIFRFNNKGDRAVSAVKGSYTQGSISLLDLNSPGKVRWQLEESPSFVQFTGDDRHVLVVLQLRAKWGHEGYNSLMVLDAETGKKVSEMTYHGQFYGTNADGSRGYIRPSEGGYMILDIREGKIEELARFLPAENGAFTFLLPSGYYLTQGDALDQIFFSRNGRSQPAESYDIKYNRPDLVARAMGSPPELIAAFEHAHRKRLKRLGMTETDLEADLLPPRVQIDFGSVPLVTKTRELRVPVTITKGSSTLSVLEVTINDTPLYGRLGKALESSSAEAVDLELSPGPNKITVWVRDEKGLISSRESVNVMYQAEVSPKPSLYVVAIGIDDYVGDAHDLELAGKDATDIASVFSEQGKIGFTEVKTLILKDDLATRSGILERAALFLEQAGIDDQVVLFMAGHGVLDAEYEYRFCCSDLDVDRIADTTLTYDEIEGFFDRCLARKRVVLLDTCHAGEADEDDARLAEVGVVPAENVRSVSFQPIISTTEERQEVRVSELMKGHFVDLRIGVGAAVLASSSAHQVALEMNEVRNGIFTASVLQGIRGRKADLNGDSSIQISELLEYCQSEVKRLSGEQQEPVARHVNRSEDFSILSFR